MRKISCLLSLLFISGCCGAGLQQFSDGNWYYPNWCQYDACYTSYDSDGVDCYKKDEYVASLKPLTPEEVQYYMQMEILAVQQAVMLQQQLDLTSQQLNMRTQQMMNQTNQMMNQTNQMLNNDIQLLRDYNRQGMNNLNNYINSYDSTIHTNCIRMGNMVNCQSR